VYGIDINGFEEYQLSLRKTYSPRRRRNVIDMLLGGAPSCTLIESGSPRSVFQLLRTGCGSTLWGGHIVASTSVWCRCWGRRSRPRCLWQRGRPLRPQHVETIPSSLPVARDCATDAARGNHAGFLARSLAGCPVVLLTACSWRTHWPPRGQILAFAWPIFGHAVAKTVATAWPIFGHGVAKTVATAWPIFGHGVAKTT